MYGVLTDSMFQLPPVSIACVVQSLTYSLRLVDGRIHTWQPENQLSTDIRILFNYIFFLFFVESQRHKQG